MVKNIDQDHSRRVGFRREQDAVTQATRLKNAGSYTVGDSFQQGSMPLSAGTATANAARTSKAGVAHHGPSSRRTPGSRSVGLISLRRIRQSRLPQAMPDAPLGLSGLQRFSPQRTQSSQSFQFESPTRRSDSSDTVIFSF